MVGKSNCPEVHAFALLKFSFTFNPFYRFSISISQPIGNNLWALLDMDSETPKIDKKGWNENFSFYSIYEWLLAVFEIMVFAAYCISVQLSIFLRWKYQFYHLYQGTLGPTRSPTTSQNGVSIGKEGRAFPVVIWSEFRMRQYRDDHREDVPYFTKQVAR